MASIARRNLGSYLRPYWKSMGIAWVCSLALGLLAAALAGLIGPSVQILMPGQAAQVFTWQQLLGPQLGSLYQSVTGHTAISGTDLLAQLPGWLVVIAFSKAIVATCQGFLWERTSEYVAADLRTDLLEGYLYLDATAGRSPTGQQYEAQLSACVTTDIKMTREYIVHFYGGILREVVQILVLLGVLLGLSAPLCGLFFLFACPVLVLLRRLGKALRRRAKAALSDYAELSEWLQQRLLGLETIKHYRTSEYEITAMQHLTQGLNQRFMGAAQIKACSTPLVEIFSISALVLVLGIALHWIAAGSLSGSVALSFIASLAMLAQAATTVSRYVNSNREGAAASQRVFGLLAFLRSHRQAQQLHTPSPQATLPANVTLACRDLSFTYPGRPHPALSHFSYDFLAGKIYCLRGPSGAGKSTLFQLILGLITPDQGQVLWPSQLETDLQVGYMPQEPILLRASLAANIAYPHPHVDQDKLQMALSQVGLATFVATHLKAGVDTLLGDGGLTLSGGQTQRVLLARLFYHQYRTVLVDEGTSALDPEVEQHIYQGLEQLRAKGVTILMIAHRPSALKVSDHCLQLQAGRLLSPGFIPN